MKILKFKNERDYNQIKYILINVLKSACWCMFIVFCSCKSQTKVFSTQNFPNIDEGYFKEAKKVVRSFKYRHFVYNDRYFEFITKKPIMPLSIKEARRCEFRILEAPVYHIDWEAAIRDSLIEFKDIDILKKYLRLGECYYADIFYKNKWQMAVSLFWNHKNKKFDWRLTVGLGPSDNWKSEFVKNYKWFLISEDDKTIHHNLTCIIKNCDIMEVRVQAFSNDTVPFFHPVIEQLNRILKYQTKIANLPPSNRICN